MKHKFTGTVKKCPRCGLTKTADAFYRKANGNIDSYCKLCNIERTSKSSNKDKEYKKAYYLKTREKWLKYSKDYYYKNHIRSLERRRAYRIRAKEKIQEDKNMLKFRRWKEACEQNRNLNYN
jgi:hypothetical protein